MARFKVVHEQSWADMYTAILFESDNEEAAVMAASQLSNGPEDTYIVIDSWNDANQLPSNAKALLKNEKEFSDFLARGRLTTESKHKG